MRRLLPLLIASGIAAGCSDRPHLNPLDPANSATQGRPAGFTAFAGNQMVTLSWARPIGQSIRAYRLMRREGTETEYTLLAELTVLSQTSYRDVGLANGLDHSYQLTYLLPNGDLSAAASAIATPGPLRPWVSDFGRGLLLRLSADVRVAAPERTSALQSATDLAADSPRDRIWIADPLGGRVIGYSPATGTDVRLMGLQSPQAIAVSPDNGNVWVADSDLDQVMRYDPSFPAGPQVVRPGVRDPLSVAVDPNDFSVWVCERGDDRVRHLDANADPLSGPAVSMPSRLAVDSLTRSVWVTSLNARNVVRLSQAGVPQDTLGGFAGPIGIAVDNRRGQIWVADAAGNRVIVLDRTGAELFRVNNLLEAREVALDLATGDGWVTLPGEDSVARITVTGALAFKVRSLGDVYDVVIERLP